MEDRCHAEKPRRLRRGQPAFVRRTEDMEAAGGYEREQSHQISAAIRACPGFASKCQNAAKSSRSRQLRAGFMPYVLMEQVPGIEDELFRRNALSPGNAASANAFSCSSVSLLSKMGTDCARSWCHPDLPTPV